MKSSSLPPNDVQSQSLVDELRRLRNEASGLMMLGFDLQAAIDVAFGRIEPPAPVPLRDEELHAAVIGYLRSYRTTTRLRF
jgi:hypothetical protein